MRGNQVVITIREATEADQQWIMERAVASSVYGIPHVRDISNNEVRLAAEAGFPDFLTRNPSVVGLVAQNQDSERMGMLLLNLGHRSDSTGEPQSLIEALDVESRFWGTPAVDELIKRAAQVTAENGLRYMVGLVAEGNTRAMQKGLRLGFQLERYHICMGCDELGPTPLPAREDSQKAHDTSRAQHRLLTRRRARKRRRSKR